MLNSQVERHSIRQVSPSIYKTFPEVSLQTHFLQQQRRRRLTLVYREHHVQEEQTAAMLINSKGKKIFLIELCLIHMQYVCE